MLPHIWPDSRAMPRLRGPWSITARLTAACDSPHQLPAGGLAPARFPMPMLMLILGLLPHPPCPLPPSPSVLAHRFRRRCRAA